jgi:hypothetical protein
MATFHLSSQLVESKVQSAVNIFIISKMIDGWRNNTVDNGM